MDTFGGLDTIGGLLKNGHVWAFLQMTQFGALWQLDMFFQFSDVDVDTFGGIGHVWGEGHVSECYIYARL